MQARLDAAENKLRRTLADSAATVARQYGYGQDLLA